MTDARFAEIEGHGPCLMRFALEQLRDSQLAGEPGSPPGGPGEPWELRGQVDAAHWLTSIPRFRVIDLQRRTAPSAWGDPEAALERSRFREAFQACLDRLPYTGRRLFFKGEIAGDDTETICKEEGITASNCWVILHRARPRRKR